MIDAYALVTGKDMKTGKKTSRAKAAVWVAVGFLPIGKVAKLGKMSAKGFNAVSKGSKAAKSIKKSRAKTSSTSKIKAKKNSEAKAKAAAKARANAKKKAKAKAKNNTGKKASGAKVPKLSTLTETEQLKLANQYKKKSPINIPENANIKAQSKNGYEQISYKWKENEETIEVRWHTRTPGAPEGQGNTFVVEKKIHGTPDGQKKVQQIMVGKNKWVSKNEWQKAITDRKNGVSTPKQNKMLTDGHWKE